MWPFKQKPKKAPLPHGRRGWIVSPAEGIGWSNKGVDYIISIYVEELLVIGPMSRIRVLEISGCGGDQKWQTFDHYNGTFFPTKMIRFDAYDPIQKAYEQGYFDAQLEAVAEAAAAL